MPISSAFRRMRSTGSSALRTSSQAASAAATSTIGPTISNSTSTLRTASLTPDSDSATTMTWRVPLRVSALAATRKG